MSFRLEDISVSFGETRILSHLSLAVKTGGLEALVGPSGVGKSTVLRVIAGILQPDSGRVFIDDIDVTNVPTYRRSVGLVFQDNQLFPHLDVAANIGFGLRMAKASSQEIHHRVTHLLELVGLTGFEQRRPASLSGGEAKRVALARALAPRPRLLLLDEPLTGLDRELHDRLALDLRNILTIEGMTSLLITHDLDEANTIAHGLTQLEAPP